ncbi:MAG: hypothetical protein KIT07_03805 [Anaerolineales bacterium]|nr:hypothetical protein [Anaerolineales bacterium]
MKLSRNRVLLLMLTSLALAALACVRSAPLGTNEDVSMATEKVALTADAQIQQTLDALLGAATVETVASETPLPSATATSAAPTVMASSTATLEPAQLTALAAALTPQAPSATPEASPTSTTPPSTATPACYAARYVYDETYPDGTRVDPGQAISKTWRLQNVGTCDWRAGKYELFFVGGDRMNGSSPLTINYNVPAGGYANFTINLSAPATPGTYHGDWVLRFDGSQQVGVGPEFNLPFWVEIVVRGSTPTP